jgi:YD repeat-containing protein
MGSSTSLTGSALAVKQMRNKNVIHLPIQQTTKHNGVVQSSTYHTYRMLSNGMIVPDSVYRLKPSEAGTLSYPSVNSKGKMDKNAAYEYLEHYYAYSSTGRPMQINRRGEAPVALYWGYNDRYVTARAENCIHYAIDSNQNFKNYMAQLENFGTVTDSNRAAFNQLNRLLRQTLSTAFLTTYTYDPLLGITSECNPSGDTIFYEYDSYGRLARTRNTNGEIIQEYEYHYAN